MVIRIGPVGALTQVYPEVLVPSSARLSTHGAQEGNVRNLNLKFCGINIVSTTKDKKYGHAQREASQGLYVLTHSSTKDKKKLLDKISSALHLNWNVEIVQ